MQTSEEAATSIHVKLLVIRADITLPIQNTISKIHANNMYIYTACITME